MASVLYELGYVKDLESVYKSLGRLISGHCDRNRVESYINQQMKQGLVKYYEYDDHTGNARVCSGETQEAFLKTVKTGCKDRNGQNLMVRYRKNRVGAWACEGISHQNHLDMVLNTYNMGYLNFPNFHEANEFIEGLHEKLLAGEKWSFVSGEDNPDLLRRKTNYQILESYLQQVFAKLVLEYQKKTSENYEKIVFSEDGQYCYFNTGLLTKFARPVFILGEVKNRRASGEFFCHKPCHSKGLRELVNDYNFKEEDVSPGPEMATFFNDIGEIIYDTNVDIDFTDDKLAHIIIDGLKRNRFPKRYQQMFEEQRDAAIFGIAEKLRSSIETAELIAKRNFKYVVPQYRPATTGTIGGETVRHDGEIQFLMPIYLDFNLYDMPDFALVLSYEGGFYIPETVLTLSWAYNNARILCKPDEPWLQASRIKEDYNNQEESILDVLNTVEDEDAQDDFAVDKNENIVDDIKGSNQKDRSETKAQTSAVGSGKNIKGSKGNKSESKKSGAKGNQGKAKTPIGMIVYLENIESANNGGIKGTFGKELNIATISKKKLKGMKIAYIKDKRLKVRIIEKNHMGNSYQADPL
ncbi:MAG: DUF3825 domain-containing protein [Tissierellia bacterium]|nr:DUF3825 domain-containing protein [Tissierellia bacterium]